MFVISRVGNKMGVTLGHIIMNININSLAFY